MSETDANLDPRRDRGPPVEPPGGPEWLLAGIDPAHDAFQFAAVSRATYRDSAFLDHRIRPRPAEVRTVAGEAVDRALASAPPPPAGWIFHTAFCCSTLLAHCLDHPERTLVLREPAVLSRLAALCRESAAAVDTTLLQRVICLSERPFAGERVVVKPSNYANALLPALATGPGKDDTPRSCVLMSCSLRALLLSVLKKQDEAERLLASFTDALLRDTDYAERTGIHSVADLDLLRQAVVFWHCQRYQFQAVSRAAKAVTLGLTMERFLAEPASSLAAVGAHLSLGLGDGLIQDVVEQGAFTRHAKSGAAYGPDQRRVESAAMEQRHGETVAGALRWAETVLRDVPVEPLMAGEDPIGG
ncbi:hypothetical protein [Elongatibacter sediminis]|uniref:Uncharacterized protein n=1 Tax=Elongatibacter sediminis TaxID=3119006 RepID=A0AAW9RJA3_9GAMM